MRFAGYGFVIAEQIGAVGFCLGGHVGFRAALSPRVKATALFYPTGLHDGDLAGDAEHTFMRDVGARYDPSATDAALAESIAWSRENLI